MQLHVQLLGELVVTADGVPIEVTGPRARALLARLALEPGQTVSVDRLVDDLWGGEPLSDGAGTLRVHVSKLRKALPDGVLVTRKPGYALLVEPAAVDASEFRRLLASDPSAATGLWRGEPLTEFADLDWARESAAELTELYLAAMEAELGTRVAGGDTAWALSKLPTLCAQYPTREHLWELHMRALYAAGRQADALAAYQRLREALLDELGLDPSPELRRLESQILDQTLPVPDAAARAEIAAARSGGGTKAPEQDGTDRLIDARAISDLSWVPVSRGGFAGREREWAKLEEAWAKASAGEPQVVLVAGEPGIGKTRLVGEFARRVVDDDGLVVFGRCPSDGADWALQELMGGLIDRLDDVQLAGFVDQAGPIVGELVRVAPNLRHRMPSVPEPLDAGPSEARHRLADAILAVLSQVPPEHPVMSVIDDLHWAGPTALMLFQIFAANAGRDAPVMLVGTFRDTDIDRRHGLTEILADARRAGTVTRIDLRGLDADTVRSYLTSVIPGTVDADVDPIMARIVNEAAGNPLYAAALATHLVDTGVLVTVDGRLQVRGEVADLPIPEGLTDMIGSRLNTLSDGVNEVLRAAAVMGLRFSIDVVERLDLGVPVLDALEEATRAGIVNEAREFGYYDFTHGLVRTTLLAELSTPRRTRLHWRIGELLCEQGKTADAALHLLVGARAGDPMRAAEAGLDAAEDALTRLEFEEALWWAERGLQCLDDDSTDLGGRLLAAQDQARTALDR